MVDWVYFMRDHAKPDDANVYAVYRIIMEELNPYFDGSVSAQEVAERLQNRVQLYLNERQNEEKRTDRVRMSNTKSPWMR